MKRRESAARSYETRREEIDLLLGEIESGLDEHRPARPKLIQWGHVGDLEHIAQQLRNLADRLHNRGEYGRTSS